MINAVRLTGPRSKAGFTSGGISVEFEPPGQRANVSLSIDPYFQDRVLRVRVAVSSNATQLGVEAAQEFVQLYQRVLELAKTLQGYLDSVSLVTE